MYNSKLKVSAGKLAYKIAYYGLHIYIHYTFAFLLCVGVHHPPMFLNGCVFLVSALDFPSHDDLKNAESIWW